MLRFPVQRHLADILAVEAQADERERSGQWRSELDIRAEREVPLFKQIADAAAGDVTLLGGYRAARDHEIIAAALITSATVAAAAANYASLTIQRFRGDGGGAIATLGTATTQTIPWTAATTVEIAIDPTLARVLAGEWVTLVINKVGAGVVVPALAVSLTQKRKQSWR